MARSEVSRDKTANPRETHVQVCTRFYEQAVHQVYVLENDCGGGLNRRRFSTMGYSIVNLRSQSRNGCKAARTVWKTPPRHVISIRVIMGVNRNSQRSLSPDDPRMTTGVRKRTRAKVGFVRARSRRWMGHDMTSYYFALVVRQIVMKSK